MEPKSQPTSPQRWAADDERGALNLIDQASVRRALGAARLCRVVALGIPLNSRTPVLPPRPPVLHAMLVDGADYSAGARRAPNGFQFADDYLAMAIHSGTHLDALSHVARNGIMYNGIPATEVRSRSGAHRLGVEKVGGIVCRGILLDVASTKPWEPSRVITTSDLQQAMLTADTEIEPGDAVLIRTGWLSRSADAGEEHFRVSPGIGIEAARWLADHGVVLVGADNPAVEVLPSETGDVMPVHLLLLNERGVYLLEFANLEALSAAHATTFTFVVAPLPITGAVGSPVNPIAII